MAMYLDEEDAWKCSKHPSKRRRSGICPICLRDRLITLCPDCANVRPCCCCATSSSSSSSSTSSFARFSISGDGVGTTGRVYNLIDSEPSLRRSRSMAIPFLRSRSRFSGGDGDLDSDKDSPALHGSRSTRSFWSLFKTQKSKRSGVPELVSKKVVVEDDIINRKAMMLKSRSVAMSSSGVGELRPSPVTRGKGWFFPSPMKAFRQSKPSKIVQERPPLYRG